ncbi:unnamed protein product, partial [Rotaria socialis]
MWFIVASPGRSTGAVNGRIPIIHGEKRQPYSVVVYCCRKRSYTMKYDRRKRGP